MPTDDDRKPMHPRKRKWMLRHLKKQLQTDPDFPEELELDGRGLKRLTTLAIRQWSETNWADEYPHTVPCFRVEGGRLCLTFAPKPDELELEDY